MSSLWPAPHQGDRYVPVWDGDPLIQVDWVRTWGTDSETMPITGLVTCDNYDDALAVARRWRNGQAGLTDALRWPAMGVDGERSVSSEDLARFLEESFPE